MLYSSMIVNESQTTVPLLGKQWKSVHSLVEGFPRVKVRAGLVTFPTVLRNYSDGGEGWQGQEETPSLFSLSFYEMGQILGGN